jgi:hypothetical protein
VEDFRVYGFSISSLLVSGIDMINDYIQFIVLVLTAIYTTIQIIKKLKDAKG